MNSNLLILIITISLIITSVILLIVFINKKLSNIEPKQDDKSFLLLQQQLSQVSEQLNKNNSNITNTIQEQFKSSAKIITNVTEKLAELDATNKQVVGIADQLQGLENVLTNPKQRGILGEYHLETLLENLFQPDQFEMQYSFSNGDTVDAALFVKEKIIPIDSKFSLENYNKLIEEKDKDNKKILEKSFKQDLKKRVDETSKYIRPNENTMDFAFMFIPSEAIYYDLLVNKIGDLKVNTRSLLEYAFRDKRVVIVSPTSFAAFLQTIQQGLNALKIEESIKDVIKNVSNLHKHLLSYETYIQKLGSNLGTTVSMYNNAYKEFRKINKDVSRVTGEKIDTETLVLDKPKTDIDQD